MYTRPHDPEKPLRPLEEYEEIFTEFPDRVKTCGEFRLLDVRQSEEGWVRLVETHTEQGPYIALSHCWGHETRRPIRTTRATFKGYLDGIPFISLPKTFQDAVKICRESDVRYLWIDSLCIIQDNEDDWLRESAHMGTIYENARLAIAESSARDSTEGCFLSDCGFHDGSSATTYFAALPAVNHEPYFSQLGSRAWACQEWYLSR
ncbi:heterokaryon incompatibility protein-domain-containing protein [Leptodontidium sp. MPI-SDFR-AT-0119]|nr:heterokaryon incompatibility protein-domain-containing protein [Leptodontidium sp. MPI-SDFR-AT-0119]